MSRFNQPKPDAPQKGIRICLIAKPDLYKRLKISCIQRNTNTSRWFEEQILAQLARDAKDLSA